MNILVTGHKGFIGSHVFKHLQDEGHEVRGLDKPDDIRDFIRFYACDSIRYDVIVHLAAFAALRESVQDPNKFWENNVTKTKPIFEYCKINKIRLLYASSAGVHEWWQNPYAITKKVNESMAPPNSVGMRFFNVWAEENSREDMLYRMLVDNTAKYLTTHKRDWIHVHDVAEAICCLIPSTFTGPIDIGTGQETSVLDLANALGRGSLPIKEVLNEPDSLCADTTKLRDLGWSPTINILERIETLKKVSTEPS